MLQILNEIKNNMIKLWSQSKNQGYISLHVTKINNLHRMHCIQHVISCIISRHFMLHFTSFHVVFHIISCCISHISLHALHASHTYHACRTFNAFHASHAYHACHASRILRTTCISCIAPHSTSFYVSFHVISSWKFITYSFMALRIEERRNRVKTPHSSIGRHLSEAF